jgi:hypothetical protein
MNSENSITADSKNELSNGELFTVFGIILSITFSSSLLTYKSINQYIKWKSLDSDRKYQYEIKLKHIHKTKKLKMKKRGKAYCILRIHYVLGMDIWLFFQLKYRSNKILFIYNK